MTVAEKINVLLGIFQRNTNRGVLTWGPVAHGYRWNCESHGVAQNLAEILVDNVRLMGLDPETFPYHIEPVGGASVVFEPTAD